MAGAPFQANTPDRAAASGGARAPLQRSGRTWRRRRARTLRALTALAVVTLALSPAAGRQLGAVHAGRQRPTATPIAAAEPVATFSIVARDEAADELGVAVQSRFLAVGSVVPWARAGVGAIATQAFANTTYGPRALALLADGTSPEDVLAALLRDDPGKAQRQVGIIDAQGRAATFTGDACLPWAGGLAGRGYAVQGNILAGPEVPEAMAAAFETTSGALAERLLAALAAGQAAGGDARGRQSAALLVVRAGAGYGGFDDRYIDLRVDDHPAPIRELRRLLGLRMAQVAVGQAGEHLRAGRPDAAADAAARATRLAAAILRFAENSCGLPIFGCKRGSTAIVWTPLATWWPTAMEKAKAIGRALTLFGARFARA